MKFLLLLIATLTSAAVYAEDTDIATALKAVNPNIKVDTIAPSPMPGVLEVTLASGETLYSSQNGEYFVLGQLFQVKGGSLVNISEEKKNVQRKQWLSEIDEKDTLIFPAVGEEKAVLHVFTDVDCGYCRKLHNEIGDINALGISVHYLGYPRAGIGSPSYQKLKDAWCAEDPKKALTELKQGGSVASVACDTTAIEDQYALGQKMGVNGTPALLTAEGRLIPGYMPAKRLARELGL
jgi:thiol:disulfide interchange protein DsbC